VRDAYESIRLELSGISPMNVVVEAPEGGSVLEPEALAAIDGLTLYLGEQLEVGKAISVADPLRQLVGGFLDDPSQPLPDSYAQATQSMLLLDSVEIIGDIITPDHRFANVMLRVDDNGSARLVDLAGRARDWWDAHGVDGYTATPTGIMYEFARAEEAIAHGQLGGLAVAFAVISGILFAIFRWPRLALMALVPNALPLFIIFGCMGLLGIPIDAGTVVMGSLALGIAVDDTIHVTTTFSIARERGLDARKALQHALSEVLPAVCASTLMLTIAFGLFAFSEFAITRNLGWLTGSIMVLCLLADVTLLSALLLRLPEPPASLRT
jgi:predicted RND superfamily exporter protein